MGNMRSQHGQVTPEYAAGALAAVGFAVLLWLMAGGTIGVLLRDSLGQIRDWFSRGFR